MGERRDSTQPWQIIAKESDPQWGTRISQFKPILPPLNPGTRNSLLDQKAEPPQLYYSAGYYQQHNGWLSLL